MEQKQTMTENESAERKKKRKTTIKLFQSLMKSFATPPELTVSQWADAYRRLSPESSSEPGQWNTDRAPYQRAIMDAVSDSKVWKIVIMCSAQVGKALDVNTPIPTPTGYRSMGDLKVGDVVFDEKGKQCNVTFATEYQYNRKCYEITFSDGSSIIADAEHRWYVESELPLSYVPNPKGFKKGIYEGVLTTKEIADSYISRVEKNGKVHHRYAVPTNKPLQLEEKELPIDPYVFGVWLGDGNSASSQITMHKDDLEISEYLKERCEYLEVRQTEKRNPNTMNVYIEPRGKCEITMHKKLHDLGVLKNKHIPIEYLRASYKQRLELLQGIMDTDGTCNKNGRAEIVFKSKRLIEDTSELLHSLGIKHSIKTKNAKCTNSLSEYECTVYRISFLVYDDMPIFKLKRKLDRMISRNDGYRRTTETERRKIVDVVEVPTRSVKCIQVDSESHLYLAGKAMIPTHNTEIMLNTLGYHIDYDPAPILYVMPNDTLAQSFSKERLAPMIRDCPTLKSKVQDVKTRATGNTILNKQFPGGYIAMVGANAPSGLSSRPVRIVLMDEVDRFPASAGTEGDPAILAIKRTTTFWNRKIIEVSTPTMKGASKIEKEYECSSMEHLNVACPHCGFYQTYEWEQLKFEHESGTTNFKLLGYKCRNCGKIEREVVWKRQPIKWVADHPEIKDVRGFHLNELASPWKRWDEVVRDFLDAKRQGKDSLKAWRNTSLGLTWEDASDLNLKDILQRRRKFYNCPQGTQVPKDCLVLTCGVDTQDNRLEYEIVGWGKDKRSWGIKYGVLMGDPGQQEVWKMLDDVIMATYKREDGMDMPIWTTCVDYGGHHSKAVAKYARKREHSRVWAIRGEGGSGKPYVLRPKRRNDDGIWLWRIGVDVGKDLMASRLKTDHEDEAGFCYFPMEADRGYDEQYFEGLTSERKEIRTVNGAIKISWIKKYEGIRNEPWDLRNYATVALEILNPNLDRLYELYNVEGKTVKEEKTIKKRGRVNKGVEIW